MRYLITGANRGLGLEFVRQLARRGDEVVATARDPEGARELSGLQRRHPERITMLPCDVSDDASVVALADRLGDTALDVLINNAGVMGTSGRLGRLRFEQVLETLNVNAVGPLRVAQAVLPHLRRGAGRRIVQITSGLGSIGENASGGYLDYRMSKAALNMLARNLAQDLGGEGFISIALQPGWVQTDMGGRGAPTPVARSVAGMLGVIDGLTAGDNGRFLGWDGSESDW